MKLPSIQQVFQDAAGTLRRFPFVLTSAVLGTAVALILVDYEGPEQPTILFKVLLASALGIPLLSAFALAAERMKWSKATALGCQVFGVILLLLYAFTVPSDLSNSPLIHLLRFQLLAIALVLLLTAGPFVGKGELNGFWQYNKTLFFRALTAFLFAGVLFVGLAIALAALDNLFGVRVPDRRYPELWILITGIFAMWFFLAGIPKDLASLDNLTDYSKGLKIFAQYILSPLVLVYFVILYSYIAKIVIEWNWPQGWVSRMILGFAALALSAMLILFPIRERLENAWMKRAARWFWFILLPLVVVLFLAVWRRVSDYGITELRYCGLALVVWLAGMALYFIFSRSKNIKVLPASLCLMALLISFGPWSMSGVSEKSQVDRLRNLLSRNSILLNGMVQKASSDLPVEDTRQISSILWYLRTFHGYECIQPWFQESLIADSIKIHGKYKEPEALAKMMGIKYDRFSQPMGGGRFSYRAVQEQSINVDGYDRLITSEYFNPHYPTKEFPDAEIAYFTSPTMDTMTFVVHIDRKSLDSVTISLDSFLQNLYTEYGDVNAENIPLEKMTLNRDRHLIKLKLCFRTISGIREEGRIKPSYHDAYLLYTIKERTEY